MQQRLRNNEYRNTTVCVDVYTQGALEGRFYNPYLTQGETFKNLIQFLLKMERTLDNMNLPQSFTAVRSFATRPNIQSRTPAAQELQEGAIATFSVRVLFRQNASWQGSVSWLEGGVEQSFRSALELIFLMNSALESVVSTPKDHGFKLKLLQQSGSLCAGGESDPSPEL